MFRNAMPKPRQSIINIGAKKRWMDTMLSAKSVRMKLYGVAGHLHFSLDADGEKDNGNVRHALPEEN